MIKLSIILPIYNVEKYIVKCLDSIYSQSVNEHAYEVIAVIDGSPDNCLAIVEKYAQSHTNLIVINKENGGVSSTRNKGIEVSKGEYIMFVDPDDTLLPNSLNKVFEKLYSQSADMFIFRTFCENTYNEISKWKGIIEENTCLNGYEVYEKWGTKGAVWGVAYNRAFWHKNSITFPLKVKNSEDSIVFLLCQMKAERIFFIDVELYSVFTREDSASHHMTPLRIEQWFEALNYTKNIKSRCINEIEISMIDGLNYSIISSITNNAIKVFGWQAKNFLYKHHIKDFLPLSKENIKKSSGINKFIKTIINHSFTAFFIITYLRIKFVNK